MQSTRLGCVAAPAAYPGVRKDVEGNEQHFRLRRGRGVCLPQ